MFYKTSMRHESKESMLNLAQLQQYRHRGFANLLLAAEAIKQMSDVYTGTTVSTEH